MICPFCHFDVVITAHHRQTKDGIWGWMCPIYWDWAPDPRDA